jgi:hypothetical protein
MLLRLWPLSRIACRKAFSMLFPGMVLSYTIAPYNVNLFYVLLRPMQNPQVRPGSNGVSVQGE